MAVKEALRGFLHYLQLYLFWEEEHKDGMTSGDLTEDQRDDDSQNGHVFVPRTVMIRLTKSDLMCFPF